MTPIHPERPTWHSRAACHGLTDLFFPEKGDAVSARKAKAVCATCDVRKLCSEQGRNEQHGVWGGDTYKHRGRTRREAAQRAERAFQALREAS